MTMSRCLRRARCSRSWTRQASASPRSRSHRCAYCGWGTWTCSMPSTRGEAQWRAGHEEFWHSEEIRAELGDPEFTVDDDTLIVAERFRLIERLAGAYLGLTWGGGGRRAARARAAGHPHSPGPGRTGQPPSHRGPG